MPDELEIMAVIGVALASFLGLAQQGLVLRKTQLEVRKLQRDLDVVQPANSSPRQAQRVGSSSPIREKLALLVVLGVLAGATFYFGASSTALSGFEVLAVALSASGFVLVLTGYEIATMARGLLNVSTDLLSVCREMIDGMGGVFAVEEEPP